MKSIGGKVRTGFPIFENTGKGSELILWCLRTRVSEGPIYIPPDPHPSTSSFFEKERTTQHWSKVQAISIFKSLNPKPYFKSYKVKLQTQHWWAETCPPPTSCSFVCQLPSCHHPMHWNKVCILQILKEVTLIGSSLCFWKHWVLPNVEAQRGTSCIL